jgi:hypothetical protein
MQLTEMKGQLEESPEHLENTDELPVLSEEAVLRLELEAGARAEGGRPADRLDSSIEALREMIERAEERWSRVEVQLEAQDRAIEELRDRLGHAGETGEAQQSGPVPELTDVVGEHGGTSPELPQAVAVPAADALFGNAADAGTERVLLERIAYLEAYIARRTERWRDMEAELNAKALRIAELERELVQTDGFAETMGGASHGRQSRQDGHPALVCLTHDAPERIELDKEWITIGRGPDCDVRIPAHFVSRWHATIRRIDGEAIIEDEHSMNGVYVNDEAVERRTLRDGDRITIGESQFRFCGSEAAS